MSINQRKITRRMLADLVKYDSERAVGSSKIESLRALVKSRLPEGSYKFLERLRAECFKYSELLGTHNPTKIAESRKEITRLHKIIKRKFL